MELCGDRSASTKRKRPARSPTAGKSRVRSIAAEPQLCVPTAEEALLEIYAGDGRAHHRDSQGTIPQGRRALYLDSQRRRHEEGGNDYLRRRMDATYVWHADHSNGGDSATAARECGTCGGRGQRVARAFEHSGRHGHGGHFRQFARLSESSDARGHFLRFLDETHYADTLEARAVGFVQLLEQHAEIRGQFSEGPLWRRGYETKRLGVRLPAESGSQLFMGAAMGRHVQRHRQRHDGFWDERRGDRSRFQEKH